MSEQLLTTVGSKLQAQLGEVVIAATQEYDFPVFEIDKTKIHEVLAFLKNEGFTFLTTACGLHYPDQSGKEIGMMYQLHQLPTNERIRIKTFTGDKEPVFPTITDLFAGANWMEREAFDFFGIKFTGHPDLRRILNMDELVGHPLRKEFALEDPDREDKDDRFFGRGDLGLTKPKV